MDLRSKSPPVSIRRCQYANTVRFVKTIYNQISRLFSNILKHCFVTLSIFSLFYDGWRDMSNQYGSYLRDRRDVLWSERGQAGETIKSRGEETNRSHDDPKMERSKFVDFRRFYFLYQFKVQFFASLTLPIFFEILEWKEMAIKMNISNYVTMQCRQSKAQKIVGPFATWNDRNKVRAKALS